MRGLCSLLGVWLVIMSVDARLVQAAGPQQEQAGALSSSSYDALLKQYCVTCHNEGLAETGNRSDLAS